MADVRRLFDLQDQLKSTRDSVKERMSTLRSELSNADASVKSYMLENGLEICNYQDQRLQLAISERPIAPNRAAIMAGLRQHMPAEEADRCMADIQAAAGTKRTATLRRARRAAARAAPRRRAAASRAAASRAAPSSEGPAQGMTAEPTAPARAPAVSATPRPVRPQDFDAPPSLDVDSD